MSREIYFFDSYAIVEIIKGSESYDKYKNAVIITTKLNLFEVFYGLLRSIGEKEAYSFLNSYYELSIDFDKEVISEASKFKLQYKKRNLSMVDCIGYILSKKWNVKFLTGDKEFHDLENVEFVK